MSVRFESSNVHPFSWLKVIKYPVHNPTWGQIYSPLPALPHKYTNINDGAIENVTALQETAGRMTIVYVLYESSMVYNTNINLDTEKREMTLSLLLCNMLSCGRMDPVMWPLSSLSFTLSLSLLFTSLFFTPGAVWSAVCIWPFVHNSKRGYDPKGTVKEVQRPPLTYPCPDEHSHYSSTEITSVWIWMTYDQSVTEDMILF